MPLLRRSTRLPITRPTLLHSCLSLSNIRNILIPKQCPNLFKGSALSLREQEVHSNQIAGGGNNQDEIEFPPDLVKRYKCTD